MPAPSRGVLVLLLAATLSPGVARAQSEASCSLPATSHLDVALNPPGGEDESAMGGQGRGLPYIAFVIDTSAHMRRFPLDLTRSEVRSRGLGCTNELLNALTYDLNPCVDGNGAFVSYTDAGCDPATKKPRGYGAPYRPPSLTVYAPYDSDFKKQGGTPGLFESDRFYVHDRGWGEDTTTVQSSGGGGGNNGGGNWVKTTALDACVAAGISSTTEQTACSACVTSQGYYLPQDASVPPVLAGNWINFYPPKYVIARKVLKDQFAAMDGAARTRQAMLTLVNDAPARCFSANKGSDGMDAALDGAALIGGGNSTGFKPPCGQFAACQHTGGEGGGRSAFNNAVNHSTHFSSPIATCPNNIAVPADAPPGTTSVQFDVFGDKVCRGKFVGSAGTLGPAVCAPYAEALLNAGQYLGQEDLYATLFRNPTRGTWQKSEFDATDSVCGSASCSCPRPAVIMILGGAPSFDDNLPCEITGRGCTATYSDDLCGGAPANTNLAKVARFLANTNLKPSDSFSYPPTVATHIIGFGTRDSALRTDLEAAAKAGKGQFFTADSANALREKIGEAVAAASTMQLSFSNASVSSVQTRTTSGLLVPRFTPSNRSLWNGQLFQFQLANEDTCGCREPAPAGDPCDFNQDGHCGGVFFKDADGAFIAANAAGTFYKARLVNGVFLPGPVPARPIWEASKALAARSADDGRKVLTVLDSNGDGAFDHQDDVVAFDESNAERLLPYLNLGPDVLRLDAAAGTGSGSFCERLGARLNVCLGPVQCAQKVIQYVRGRDVLDEDCDGSTDEERPSKLGDIFHSSPVLVDPPMSTRNVLCQLGLHNQCLLSLAATPTPLEPTTAHEDYVRGRAHRDKLVLVGANDGMLHAFRGGRWHGADNPDTPNVNECPDPASNCTGYYDLGDGRELWAFIPPDLLPKLQQLVLGQHQYFVDGTAMVRDVWADDDQDAKKEAGEFHTLAVVGERRGGNHFFALDVTAPEGPTTLPSRGFFRWMYPQPNTPAARAAGESYADFLPSPPPIGPVRLKTSAQAHTGTYQGEDYEERWVALLNGGYDEALLRGRTVSMVDAWRGGDGTRATSALWTFDAGDSGAPFAATPAMVGFGPTATNPNNDPNGYFFDTATVGDVGGQLWTLRFNHPDPARWAGGRMLLTGATGGMCGRQPFFQMTANTVAVKGGHLRTLVGTGDRFNLNDVNGGECSATNLVGCLRRGCTLEQVVTRTACGKTASYRRVYGGPNTASACESVDTLTLASGEGSACCTSTVEARVDSTLTCTNQNGTSVTIPWQARVTCQSASGTVCGASESQFVCETPRPPAIDICSRFDRCREPITPPRNGFYAVKTFDDQVQGRGIFDSPEAARAYDQAALTPASRGMVQVDPYTPTATAALPANAGWYVAYGAPRHDYPPGFDGSAVDERTVSQAVLVGGCAIFNTSTPASSPGICHRTLVSATTYYLNLVTGTACTGLDPEVANVRLVQRLDTQAPAPPQLAIDVTPMGTVNIKLAGISRSSGGAAQTTPLSSNNELIKASYRLPVSRTLHQCRHPDGASVADQRASAQESCASP